MISLIEWVWWWCSVCFFFALPPPCVDRALPRSVPSSVCSPRIYTPLKLLGGPYICHARRCCCNCVSLSFFFSFCSLLSPLLTETCTQLRWLCVTVLGLDRRVRTKMAQPQGVTHPPSIPPFVFEKKKKQGRRINRGPELMISIAERKEKISFGGEGGGGIKKIGKFIIFLHRETKCRHSVNLAAYSFLGLCNFPSRNGKLL